MPKTIKKKETHKKIKKAKKTETPETKEEVSKIIDEDSKNYLQTVGRRKTAVARVRLFTSSPARSVEEGNLLINNRPYKEYFPTPNLQKTIEAPFIKLKSLNRFSGTIKVKGGGITGQAEAIRHGLSRALVLFDINFRKKLKKSGYLTRDARAVERKKFGFKKARRRPQWSKR